MPNDNRMGWIRNLEVLVSGCPRYTVEYELGSECDISGLLDYADGQIVCAPMTTEESREGLFKDGILGELIALMSLFFRYRFYGFHTPGFGCGGIVPTRRAQPQR
jgi:hypothetical protein